VLTKRGFWADDVGARQGALDLATAFPRGVWLDYLLPHFTFHEAVMLRATCKSMRAITADMRADLGRQPVEFLRDMLTCFPKAISVTLDETVDEEEEGYLPPAEVGRLVAWVRKRGNSLTRVNSREWSCMGPFVRRGWRAGLFKAVKSVSLDLSEFKERDLIVDGVVSGVESIALHSIDEGHDELAALGHLRHLPALKEIACYFEILDDVILPPFIPPSLEVLKLESMFAESVLLLGCLPPMIESSGAKLRRLHLSLGDLGDEGNARGVQSLLQACAPTLKEIAFDSDESILSAVELVEGLAGCPHLESVSIPLSAFAAVSPGGGATIRLAHLCLSVDLSGGRDLSTLALWGLMARGGFPTLTSLTLNTNQWHWGAELGPALLAAFEGVAGTLKTLTLTDRSFDKNSYDESDEGGVLPGADAVLMPLGEAIGRLQKLETLELDLGGYGLAYHWIAWGMAKGEGACPALRSLTCAVERDAVWLGRRPSIILPSVRALRVNFFCSRGAEPLSLACGLNILGYEGAVIFEDASDEGGQWSQIRELLQPRANLRFIVTRIQW
jgi:hypothetical protein